MYNFTPFQIFDGKAT